MKTTHTLTWAFRCPVDDTPDIYRIEVTTETLIRVEDIRAACGDLMEEPRYQEDITAAMATRLGAHVVTTGHHSGVETVCEAGE